MGIPIETALTRTGTTCLPSVTAPASKDTLVIEPSRWGVAVAWNTKKASVHADQAGSLLTGKSLKLRSLSLRADLELPIVRGQWAGLAFRNFLGLRIIDGELPAVTLRDLVNRSPGLTSLLAELNETLGGLSEDLKMKGEAALDDPITEGVQLSTIGIDLGTALVVSGFRVSFGESYLEWLEFSVGAFGNGSWAEVTIVNKQKTKSEKFFAWGLGGFLSIAPLTLHVSPEELAGFTLSTQTLEGIRIQPLAAEAGLFVLMHGRELVAPDVSLTLYSRLQIDF